MGLALLTEGDWERIERVLIGELEEACSTAPFEEHWVVIPSKGLRRHLQVRTARSLGATSGIHWLLPAEAAGRVFQDDLRSAPTVLSRLARDVLVRRLLRERGGAVADLLSGQTRTPPALYQAVLRTISDLREAHIEPEAVEALAGRRKGRRADRLRFIAGLYRDYIRGLDSGGRTDAEGLLHRAAERLRSAGVARATSVRIYGFYDVTAGQAALIDALIASGSVRMYTPLYPESEVYAADVLAHWRALADEIDSEPGAAPPDRRLSNLPELWSELAAGVDGDHPGEECVIVASAPGKGREVDAALRLVASAWDAGYRSDQTRVVAPAAGHYARLLEQEARTQGLGSEGDPAPEESLYRFLVSVLSLAEPEFEAEGVARYLDLVGLAADAGQESFFGATPVRGVAGRGDLAGWIERLQAEAELAREQLQRMAAPEPEEGDTPDHALLRKTSRIGARLRSFEWAIPRLQELKGFLEDPPPQQSWNTWCDWLAQAAEVLVAPEWSDAVGAVLDPLRELALLDEKVERESVLWALRRSWQNRRQPGGLTVETIMEIRGVRVPLLIVLGLAEGSWPTRPAQDPLLLDDERQALSGARDWLLPTVEHRAREERLLFRLLLEVGERTVLLHPRLDEEGNQRYASPHTLDLVRRLHDKTIGQAELEELALNGSRPLGRARPIEGEPLLGEMDRDISAAAGAVAGEQTADFDALWESSYFAAGWKAEMARWRGRPGPWSGVLGSEQVRQTALQLLGMTGERPLSASLLETYALCPWRVFVMRILGLPPAVEDVQGLLDPAERGVVLHSVLREYVAGAIESGRWVPGAADLEVESERLERLVRQAVQRAYRSRPVRHSVLQEADSRLLADRLRGWLRWEISSADTDPDAGSEGITGRGWVPILLEADVSAALPAGGGRVALRGRLDRVDRRPDGRLRILDYKTGSRVKAPDDLQGGTNIQLALYLLAAEEALAGEGAPSGAALLHLDPKKPAAGPNLLVLDHRLVDEGREKIGALVEALIGGMESGLFLRMPLEGARDPSGERCVGCPAPDICGGWPLKESLRFGEDTALHPLNRARAIRLREATP